MLDEIMEWKRIVRRTNPEVSADKVTSSSLRLQPSSWSFKLLSRVETAAAKIFGAVVASFGTAYVCDTLVADQKIFGGTTPATVSNKGWWEETDKKFQAWPRTAGPPVVMNPINRQNFIIKSSES